MRETRAKFPSDEGSECSSVTSESIERYHGRTSEGTSRSVGYNLKTIYSQLQARQDEIERLREKVDAAKTLQQEVQFLNSALQVVKTNNKSD